MIPELKEVWAEYKAYLMEKYPAEEGEEWKFECPHHQKLDKLLNDSNFMREYRERKRNNQKASVLDLLFAETHNHMGTSATPCVFDFQFDEIVNKIDEIYHPQVALDDEAGRMSSKMDEKWDVGQKKGAIKRVGVLQIGGNIAYNGDVYIITAFPTRYSVVCECDKPNLGNPSLMKFPISKLKYAGKF